MPDIEQQKKGIHMENAPKFTPQGRTKLVQASILQPELSGLHLVVIPCSETGKPDTALHKILDRKWATVSRDLKGWFAHHLDFKLGSINTVAVQSDVWIVHMLCFDKQGQLNEAGLASCMKKLSTLATMEKASVHMSVLTLDAIPTMQDLVKPWLLDRGVHTYFYQEKDMVAVYQEHDLVAPSEETATKIVLSEDETDVEPVKSTTPKKAVKSHKKSSKKVVLKKAAPEVEQPTAISTLVSEEPPKS